ncbi:MAG TPA: tetratricopeptide repeat protein [Pirellulaceae bacterium]|nr:tetratricopeptide repeat protein [Pirellulaceae bacterium]
MAHFAAKSQPRKPKRGDAPPRWRWSWWWLVPATLLLCAGWLAADWWIGIPEGARATYVGRRTCIECHQQQGRLHEGSHHDLAMDLATPQTVCGDFSDQTLEHHGVTSRMFRRGEKYLIETEGPDGKLGEFEIKYVFGATPLQQYMVEFDRPADMPKNEIARLQVLRVSWNTREKKWFHLDPPDVHEKLDPSDDLHWTGIAQRWNTMCADCHSTNLQRNFDETTATYHTTFSEIDVSCEACHGPGSHHVTLARQFSPFWDRKQGYALARIKGEPAVAEIESCAPCHSRRSTIHGGYVGGSRFHDFYASELLSEATYHADGQILDEVYEYGSFTQSKMFHKNVRCSDCHDPHSLKLKFSGNQVCTSCHQHPGGKYDTIAHHNHKPGSAAAQCISCHMPATSYMDVDPRRDHSFRVPRPDLSLKFGSPNACTGCHIRDTKLPDDQRPKSLTANRPVEYADWLRDAREGRPAVKEELTRLDAWCETGLQKWFPQGLKREPHFTAALAAAHRQSPDAQQRLVELLADRMQPAIARATAAMDLAAYVHTGLNANDEPVATLIKSLADRDAQVRAAAATSLTGAHSDVVSSVLPTLLKDPLRTVRTRAALALSELSADALRRDEPLWLKKATEELLAGASSDSDRAGSHLLRGTVLESQGRLAEAQEAFELALRLEPHNASPKGSMARLLDRLMQREHQRVDQLVMARDRAGAERHARQAAMYAARFEELKEDEWSCLERDARLVRDNAGLQIQAGLSRYQQGWKKEAEYSLAAAHWLSPRNPATAYYLAILYRDTGRIAEARALAQRLVALRPKQPEYEQLLADLPASAEQ